MPLNPILVIEIFDCWGIDFKGPFPPSFSFFFIKCKNCIDQKELETSNTRKREQNPLTKSKARQAC
jgi:hypothetical protein